MTAIPKRDSETGGLRGGVAEDFPNGGGNRAYLFVVDGPDGRFSWFYQNSASAVDLHVPIVVDGKSYGAPIENLKSAMKDAGLESVDLWIGSGGVAIAQLVLPVIKPRAFLPVHWDGLWGAFSAGVPKPYADPALEALLTKSDTKLVRPEQYMDKWRLSRAGVAVAGECRGEAGTRLREGVGARARIDYCCCDVDVFLPISPFSTSTAFSICASRPLMKSPGVLSTCTSGGTP